LERESIVKLAATAAGSARTQVVQLVADPPTERWHISQVQAGKSATYARHICQIYWGDQLRSEVARHLQPLISEALTDTRVVGIVGPRQAGKSTLAQRLVAMNEAATYVTFDDLAVRTTAEADPQGFVTGRSGLLAIDEVQRVPNLLLAIKAEVDRDQRPGRFLITGSAQLSATRGVSDTLAGRIERFELWPFSRSEVTATPATLIDRLLDGDIPRGYHSSTTKLDYLELAIAGGSRRRWRGPGVADRHGLTRTWTP